MAKLGYNIGAGQRLAISHCTGSQAVGQQCFEAMCPVFGIGSGALLMSLRSNFGSVVLGIEADDVVLSASKRHFGLMEDDF